MPRQFNSRSPAIEFLEHRLPLAAELLLDYNTTEIPFHFGPSAKLENDVFFVANNDSTQSIELWKVDATAVDATPVATIESDFGRRLRVLRMVALQDQLLLLATQGDPPDVYLYVSDGSSAGTVELLKLPFGGGVDIDAIRVVDGNVYFTAYPWHGSPTLMVTDGTVEGTRVLGHPKGPPDNVAVTPSGKFFAAGGSRTSRQDGQFVQYATQLWYYDDQEQVARMVAEIESPHRDDYADPNHLTTVGDNAFFTAETRLGRELWFSDSTSPGTYLVRDLRVGALSSNPSALTSVGEQLFFLADDGRGITLWRATSGGDYVEVDFVGAPFNLVPDQLLLASDDLYVLQQSDDGVEVLAYSTITKEIDRLGTVSGREPRLEQTRLGPAVVTTDQHEDHFSLIRNDAIIAFEGMDYGGFLAGNDTIAYLASRRGSLTDIVLTSGSTESNQVVGTFALTSSSASLVGDSLVFSGRHNGRYGLWSVGPSGLVEILTPEPTNGSSTYHHVDVVDDKAIISVESGFHAFPMYTTWLSDTYVADAREATKLVSQPFLWGNHGGWPDRPRLHQVGVDYYFAAQSANYEEEIWKTDLTPEGTERSSFAALAELDPAVAKDDLFGFYPTRATPLDSDHFLEFQGRYTPVVNTSHGRYFIYRRFQQGGRKDELYRLGSDGEQDPQLVWETGLLPSFHSFEVSQIAGGEQQSRGLLEHDGVLYFLSSDPDHGLEIWRSDGTQMGTRRLVDLNPGPASSAARLVGLTADRLFVTATTPDHGEELWSITADGDARVYDLRIGEESSDARKLAILEDVVYVSADDGIHGREVWAIQKDGSAKLYDIHAGASSSDPWFTLYDSRITAALSNAAYFSADDGIHGRELWAATSELVRLEQDIRVGPIGSFPIILAQLSDAILFQANDGVHGRELWSITADEPIRGDANGDGKASFADFLILSANYGRFTTNGAASGDFDNNGTVDYGDFLELVSAFARPN